MEPTFWPGLRARFASATAVLAGTGPRAGRVSARNADATLGFRRLAASRLARERVERSEFDWSALGEFRSTGEESPVAGVTRLSFIPAASWSPNALPEIAPV